MHRTAALLPLLLLAAVAGCSPAPTPTRQLTVGGAGVGSTVAYTCDANGKVCDHTITDADSTVGSWDTQVTVPVGATVHVQVSGLVPHSCTVYDATGQLELAKVIADPGDKATCTHTVT